MKTITIETFLHYINEIVSRETYRKNFFTKERKQTKSKKYKEILKSILKKFFTPPGSTIPKRTLVIPLKDNKRKILSLNDKKIVNYLNKNGYNCTKESYDLGQCTNKSNNVESILNVLTQISSYDITAEKKKLDNPKVPDIGKQQARERVDRFNNLDKNLVNYYNNISNLNKQMIVFTWVPRKIASQSTDVGWTSCQDLFDGSQREYVFPGIGVGAFIAWLVKKGDEDKLDNPIARTLIKIYDDEYGNKLWWPDKVYGTASPIFIERVKDFLREKQADLLMKIGNLDEKQYNDGNEFVVWDPWIDKKGKKLKDFHDKYHLMFQSQKQSKKEFTKIIFNKIKEEKLEPTYAEKIFRDACERNYHELAFRLYRKYNFLPDEDVLSKSADNSDIFKFLFKDKRVKKISSSIVEKIIESNNAELFEMVIKSKKANIDADGKNLKNVKYVKAATGKDNVLKVMLNYNNFIIPLSVINKFSDEVIKNENAVYVIKEILKRKKSLKHEQALDLLDKYISKNHYELARFLIEDLKIKYTSEDEKKKIIFNDAWRYFNFKIINLIIDNVPISKERAIEEFMELLLKLDKDALNAIKIFVDKKVISEDQLLEKTILDKIIKYLNKLENDDEKKLYVLHKFKKIANEFNKKEIKYVQPRNLNSFDYTVTFARFSPKLINEMIAVKNEARQAGWIDTFHDQSNHEGYEEAITDGIKELFLRKRKPYNTLVDENRQISDELIYNVLNNKKLTGKEKVNFVNFLYFIHDTDLIILKNKKYDIFDIVAYTKAFDIRELALKNALGSKGSIIESNSKEELKKHINLNVEDYVTTRYMSMIIDKNKDKKKRFKSLIENFYKIALEIEHAEDIPTAIKDLMADKYVENETSMEIFKIAMKDEKMLDLMKSFMLSYRAYEKITMVKNKKNENKKLEIPKIDVKDYTNVEHAREELKDLIIKFYEIAINQLKLKDIDEITEIIKNLTNDVEYYEIEKNGIEIFKIAMKDEETYYDMRSCLPPFGLIEKKIGSKIIDEIQRVQIPNIKPYEMWRGRYDGTVREYFGRDYNNEYYSTRNEKEMIKMIKDLYKIAIDDLEMSNSPQTKYAISNFFNYKADKIQETYEAKTAKILEKAMENESLKNMLLNYSPKYEYFKNMIDKNKKSESKNETKKEEQKKIKTTEEVKPEIPKIKAKDYISRLYYRSIDEDQEENIEWLIKDFYEVAIDKLNLTNIKEITEAIKNLMADNYVENDIALEIFKKAIQEDHIIGGIQVNMPLYREYEKNI